MSDPWDQPWSNSPTAPPISKYNYVVEKSILAGSFIGSILYGLLTMLFFQCMTALLKPADRREEGVKWWLVFYTVAMFSFVTVRTALNLHMESTSLIDNRQDIPGDTPGPLVYQLIIRRMPLGLTSSSMFNVNNWLADGLLIYRCYIIYSTNLWAIALPCLMYLASLGMGIMTLYFQHNGHGIYTGLGLNKFGVPYLSISVSLNVLLTLMIVIRLILHGRNIRTATGSLAGITGWYKMISTMLIESCALFAGSSLLVVGALAAVVYSSTRYSNIPIIGSFVVDIFFPVLAVIQVIAPLLIIKRVANGSALTSRAIATGHTSLFNARGQEEPTGSDGTPPGSYLKNSMAGCEGNSGEPGVVV